MPDSLDRRASIAPPSPSPCHALFLDFDGTLVEIAAAPDLVRVPADLIAALAEAAAKLSGAIAIVSGCRLGDMRRLLAPLDLVIAAEHGVVLHRPGDRHPSIAPSWPAEWRKLAEAHAGLLIEEKSAGLAIHYRAAPAAAAASPCWSTQPSAIRRPACAPGWPAIGDEAAGGRLQPSAAAHSKRAGGRRPRRRPAGGLEGRVSLLQIARRTRQEISQHQALKRALDRAAGRINGRFAEFDWVPLRYINRSLSRPVLAGFHRLAQVGLVTPLRDGLNLVAKEYVAAQDAADPGVLVLSRFAGAAAGLDGALLVNPFDVEEIAEAISRALEMPLGERQARHGSMMRAVRRAMPPPLGAAASSTRCAPADGRALA